MYKRKKINEYKSNKIVENIILSTTKIVIDMKKNNKYYSEKYSERIFPVSIDENNIFKSAYCTKSIIEFLNKSYIDEGNLNKELEELEKNFSNNNSLIPYDWNRKSDDYIKENFDNIKKRVKNKDNEINPNLLKNKIDYFYNLYKLEIIQENELDELVNYIGEMIQHMDKEDDLSLRATSIYEDEDKFKEIIERLNSYVPRSFQEKVKNDTKKIFEENKIEELKNYLMDNKEKFFSEKGFLKYFNVDLIVKIYLAGNNEQKDDLGKAFNSIYGFTNIKDYFKDDIENIQKLKEKLEKSKENTKGMSRWNIENLILFLDKVLEKLKW